MTPRHEQGQGINVKLRINVKTRQFNFNSKVKFNDQIDIARFYDIYDVPAALF